MRFTVVWDQDVEEKLAALWAVADDRRAVSDAADWIDSQLRHAGESVGVPYLDDDLFLAAPPIAVLFNRSLADRLIRVVDVLMSKPKSS